MKQCVFQGVGTALITPLRANGVDLEAFRKLIRFQLDNGVRALIVAGTTGEGSVLTEGEFEELVSCAVEEAGGKATRIDGAPLQFVDAEQAIFSNGKLHDTLIGTLSM